MKKLVHPVVYYPSRYDPLQSRFLANISRAHSPFIFLGFMKLNSAFLFCEPAPSPVYSVPWTLDGAHPLRTTRNQAHAAFYVHVQHLERLSQLVFIAVIPQVSVCVSMADDVVLLITTSLLTD